MNVRICNKAMKRKTLSSMKVLELNELFITLTTHISLGTSQNMFTYMSVVNTKNHHSDLKYLDQNHSWGHLVIGKELHRNPMSSPLSFLLIDYPLKHHTC